MNAGKATSCQAAGVLIYELKGEPEFHVWGEPEIITSIGQVPSNPELAG